MLPHIQALPGGNVVARRMLDDMSVVLPVTALVLAGLAVVVFDLLIPSALF